MWQTLALAASKHVSSKCPASKVAQRWLAGFQLTSVRWILLLQNYRCYSLSQVQTRWRLLIGPNVAHCSRHQCSLSSILFLSVPAPVPVAGASCRIQLPVAESGLPVAGAGCRLPVPVASCRLPIAGWVAGAGVPCPVAKPRRLYVIIRLYAYMPIYVIRILLKEPQANHKVKLNSERK